MADDRLLLEVLADGAWHSGEALAARLGVTRAAIWKRLERLERFPGLEIERLRGRGYRLRAPLELLDEARIAAAMDGGAQNGLSSLQVVLETDSTNRLVREQAPALLHTGAAVLAEHQTAGRGRRGRRWVSVFGGALQFSLAWRFDLPVAGLAGLSLAAGVAVAETLAEFGLDRHRLKWPNDLVADGAKLAGILVEVAGEADGPCLAVIGVGLNLRLNPGCAEGIDQPWTDLARLLPTLPSRNLLAGRLLARLTEACLEYQRAGLRPFLPRWHRWDGCLDRPVTLFTPAGRVEGRARGVDAQGALRLETASGLELHHAGEVSLRERERG